MDEKMQRSASLRSTCYFQGGDPNLKSGFTVYTRVGTLIMATIYLQLIQNRYMFRSRIPLAAPVVLIVRMERSTA